MTLIDKLAWVHIVDRKLLGARSRGQATFYLPGGKREEGESDWEALAREVREELSVELLPGTEEKVGVFTAQAHGKPEGVQVRMTCYRARYEGTMEPASEIESVAWLTYADREVSSPVAQRILDWLRERDWID